MKKPMRRLCASPPRRGSGTIPRSASRRRRGDRPRSTRGAAPRARPRANILGPSGGAARGGTVASAHTPRRAHQSWAPRACGVAGQRPLDVDRGCRSLADGAPCRAPRLNAATVRRGALAHLLEPSGRATLQKRLRHRRSSCEVALRPAGRAWRTSGTRARTSRGAPSPMCIAELAVQHRSESRRTPALACGGAVVVHRRTRTPPRSRAPRHAAPPGSFGSSSYQPSADARMRPPARRARPRREQLVQGGDAMRERRRERAADLGDREAQDSARRRRADRARRRASRPEQKLLHAASPARAVGGAAATRRRKAVGASSPRARRPRARGRALALSASAPPRVGGEGPAHAARGEAPAAALESRTSAERRCGASRRPEKAGSSDRAGRGAQNSGAGRRREQRVGARVGARRAASAAAGGSTSGEGASPRGARSRCDRARPARGTRRAAARSTTTTGRRRVDGARRRRAREIELAGQRWARARRLAPPPRR